MRLGDAVSKLIKDNKKSQAGLAKMVGKKNQSFIGNICMRHSTTVDTLLEITDALDYEVIIRPRSGEGKAERTIRLSRGEQE